MVQRFAPFFWSLILKCIRFQNIFNWLKIWWYLQLMSAEVYLKATPHCWGHLVFLWPLPKIHTSHQYLEDFKWFEAIFKTFAWAILRPLRSKNDPGWILRLWPFAIISESVAANLEKVRQTSVWQTFPKFWFIWLWCLSFCNTYKCMSLRNIKKDK
jgi:hypothetical protein